MANGSIFWGLHSLMKRTGQKIIRRGECSLTLCYEIYEMSPHFRVSGLPCLLCDSVCACFSLFENLWSNPHPVSLSPDPVSLFHCFPCLKICGLTQTGRDAFKAVHQDCRSQPRLTSSAAPLRQDSISEH